MKHFTLLFLGSPYVSAARRLIVFIALVIMLSCVLLCVLALQFSGVHGQGRAKLCHHSNKVINTLDDRAGVQHVFFCFIFLELIVNELKSDVKQLLLDYF